MPARPYMERLSVLSRLICPSAWPLLQGSAMACLTASLSRVRVRANTCIDGSPEHRASAIKRSSPLESEARSRPLNRIASRRIATKLGDASLSAATFAASDGASVGFMQSEAAIIGEICHPVAGSIAGRSWIGSALCGREEGRGRASLRQVDNNRLRLEKLPTYPRARTS
jgi:hypothetical protein